MAFDFVWEKKPCALPECISCFWRCVDDVSYFAKEVYVFPEGCSGDVEFSGKDFCRDRVVESGFIKQAQEVKDRVCHGFSVSELYIRLFTPFKGNNISDGLVCFVGIFGVQVYGVLVCGRIRSLICLEVIQYCN